MARQLILDLPYRSAMGRADFYISEANAAAVGGIDAWREWPLDKMLLIGPEGSGKTHLAHVFTAQTGARIAQADALREADIEALTQPAGVVIEDAETIAGDPAKEEVLFHLHNALAHLHAPLLVTAATPPTRWGLTLPDLLSRMQQAGQITLTEPDDTLIAAVMVKLSQDRGIVLPTAVLNYALLRVGRSLAAVAAFVAALDADTLAAGEKPGVKHAKAILARQAS